MAKAGSSTFLRIFIIIILILVIISGIIIIFNKSIFLLKHVEIKKDFELNEKAIINYLGIYPLKSIFNYDKAEITGKLLNLGFVESVNVIKRIPDTIVIEIKNRKAVGLINTNNGDVCVIDKNGVIYLDNAKISEKLVLITFDKHEQLKQGMILKEKYKNICALLDELKNKYKDIYNSISQIDILTDDYNVKYFVRFNAKNQTIYLKNQINVDVIKKGLISVLYLNEDKEENLMYTNQGFVYN